MTKIDKTNLERLALWKLVFHDPGAVSASLLVSELRGKVGCMEP